MTRDRKPLLSIPFNRDEADEHVLAENLNRHLQREKARKRESEAQG